MAAAAASSSGTTSEDRGYSGKPGPTSVSFSKRKLPPLVRTVSLALAAESPIERTTRLAKNKPPANSRASPINRPIIIHIRDLDDDELPDTEPSAIAAPPSGHNSPNIQFGRGIAATTRKPAQMCSKRSCSCVQARFSSIESGLLPFLED